MSTLSQFSGGGIKSIQRGTIILSSTFTIATITAVNTAKTVLNFCGCASGVERSTYYYGNTAQVALTSSTQVAARISIFGQTFIFPTVSYEVIEYF